MHHWLRQMGWKIGIPPENMYDIYNQFQKTDFKDEYSARKFIKQTSRKTGMPISRDIEEMIIKRFIHRRR